MGEAYLVTISTYYNSCLDWYSMYAIRYKELVKKDEGINNNMEKKRDKKNKLRGKWLRGIIIHFRYNTEESAYVDFICNRIGFFVGITAILAKCGFI